MYPAVLLLLWLDRSVCILVPISTFSTLIGQTPKYTLSELSKGVNNVNHWQIISPLDLDNVYKQFYAFQNIFFAPKKGCELCYHRCVKKYYSLYICIFKFYYLCDLREWYIWVISPHTIFFFNYYLTKVRLCLYTCHNYILPCVVSEIIIIILLNRYFYVFLCLLLFYFYLIFVLHFVLLKSNITVDIRTLHYNHTLTTIKKILIQRKHFLNIPLFFDFFFFLFAFKFDFII
jgi:hypothetical protein